VDASKTVFAATGFTVEDKYFSKCLWMNEKCIEQCIACSRRLLKEDSF